MRPILKSMATIGVLLVIGTATAQAQWPGYGGGYGRGYGGGYSGGSYGTYYSSGYRGYSGGGYGGQGYGVPTTVYYGNGGHDYQPHMHNVQTPYGGYSYYGNGAHDFQAHTHVQTPYGITGYNGGYPNTTSYSSPTPYTYMPW